MIRCSECQKPNNEGAQVCASCGAGLSTDPASAETGMGPAVAAADTAVGPALDEDETLAGPGFAAADTVVAVLNNMVVAMGVAVVWVFRRVQPEPFEALR